MRLDDFPDDPVPRAPKRTRNVQCKLSGADLERFEACCALVNITATRVIRLAVRHGLPIVERELQLAARIREATTPKEPTP